MASYVVNSTHFHDSSHVVSSKDEEMDRKKTHQPQEQLEAVVYKNTNSEDYRFKQLMNVEELPKSNPIFMYLSAITACLLISSCTSCLGWTSPVITYLESMDPQVNPLGKPVTPLEISWIASLPVLGAAFGPLFTAKLADVVGRKRALIYLSIPHICSLLLLAYATDVRVYYVTRFVSGFVMGSVLGLTPVYLAEISEMHNRNTVGALITIFLTGGILYSFIIGPLVSVKAITLCCALPGLLFLIIFGIFMPESPMYLVSRDDIRGASRVLMKLRRQTADQVQQELRIIMKVVEREKQDSSGNLSELFKDAGLKKSLVICLGLFVFQQFSGLNVLISFMEQIFAASGSNMSKYVSTNLVALIQFLTSILAAAIVERFSQRTLLICSSVGTSISQSALALYFYLKTSTSYSVNGIFWLPITSFVTFFILLGLGLAVLPWVLTAEIFPTKYRATAGSLGAFSCFFSSFIVTLGFPLLRNTLGIAQCFWFFSGCTMISAIFVYCLVPETAACLLVFSCTSGLGWSSPVIPYLESTDPQINPLGEPATPLEISWIASLLVLGAAFGPLFTAKLADVVGRKRALIYLSIPHVCSLLLLAYSTDVRVYYVTRFVSGFMMGSVLGLMPVYLSEIAEMRNRNTMGVLTTISLNGGIMYAFLIGPLVSVRTITLCCALPGLLFLILSGIFMPESPIYLASKGDTRGAWRVLMKLRRRTASRATQELGLIMEIVEMEKQQSRGNVSELFKDARLKKSLMICMGLFVFRQFSGLNVIIFFMEQIFAASGTSMSKYVSTNLMVLIQFLASILTAAIVERFAQRSLLIFSSMGTSISLSAIALYFYLETSICCNIGGLFWLLIVSIVSYFVLFSLGLAVVPWGLTAGSFPTEFRATAGSLGAFSCFFCSFLVTFGFPLLRNAFGIAPCFMFFSGCTMVSSLFVYYFVPETAGKTPAEIQLMMRK